MAAEGDGAVALSRRTAEYCIEKTGAGVRAESGNGKGAAIVDIEPGINIYINICLSRCRELSSGTRALAEFLQKSENRLEM